MCVIRRVGTPSTTVSKTFLPCLLLRLHSKSSQKLQNKYILNNNMKITAHNFKNKSASIIMKQLKMIFLIRMASKKTAEVQAMNKTTYCSSQNKIKQEVTVSQQNCHRVKNTNPIWTEMSSFNSLHITVSVLCSTVLGRHTWHIPAQQIIHKLVAYSM